METQNGSPLPLGVYKREGGRNFAFFSKHGTSVRFFLFQPGNPNPLFEKTLDPKNNKTGDVWHIFIKGVPEQAEYGFMIGGDHTPEKGLLYNSSILLTDPYAKTLNFPKDWGARRPTQLHGGVVDHIPFDWQGDLPPLVSLKNLIIYEMHVRGFTKHPSSLVSHPGTYQGLIERIPHLKELGITAVELLPIFEFNECEYELYHPQTHTRLYNYWGYSTVNFFSPMRRYASSAEWHAEINEFKLLVRELHKNGIEVILDVVYNHTAEQGYGGPSYSFRGIDNPVYYMLDDQGRYKNYTGCGNTLNCNHPVVGDVILDSLRYWVTEMHVDGFRFDLASILTRNSHGTPLADPFVIAAISEDPVLSHVKLIAEAWDAAGLYQVGHFPYSHRWSDWNGQYRDTVRDFIKGTEDRVESFAKAITGSQYLYGKSGSPYQGVNFITAHDGFSLHDLVSYQHKHNEANGEDNRDGTDDNRSWNCGAEGQTQDAGILQLRAQQKRNFHLALMMSLGIPMILMGDEYGRTAYGNNNTWCQDNELNWFLWDQLLGEQDFFRFYKQVIKLRQKMTHFFPEAFYRDEDIDWHSAQTPYHPNWTSESRFIAFTLKGKENGNDIYIAFNAYHCSMEVQLPPPREGKSWFRVIDTSLPPPDDFVEEPTSNPPLTKIYKMFAHSALLAFSE